MAGEMVVRILPVIMSGGSGTRLWPLSTDRRPKQFHALGGECAMIVETAMRVRGRHGNLDFLDPVIIAGERHAELVSSQLADAGIVPAATVLEPVARNTAATAAVAALVAAELDPEALVLLLPADHVVADPAAFIGAIALAAPVASGHIVTFGIAPTGPETGYGYIHQGGTLAPGVHRVAAFKEKPDLSVARRYIEEGGYSWNSGVFMFRPDVMIEEMETGSADILAGAREALRTASRTDAEIRLGRKAFHAVRAEPVDIAVMEKTSRAAVVPCSIGWADIGSWAELWRFSPKDQAGNAVSGPVTILDGENNLVRSDGVHVSIAGVSDLIVVATADGILILPRDRAQDVKKLIP